MLSDLYYNYEHKRWKTLEELFRLGYNAVLSDNSSLGKAARTQNFQRVSQESYSFFCRFKERAMDHETDIICVSSVVNYKVPMLCHRRVYNSISRFHSTQNVSSVHLLPSTKEKL
jgi:hypothetical protein